MFERKSLRLPITLGVVMIVLLVVLIIGWVILTVSGAITDDQRAGLYWALLSIGATLLGFVLVGVVLYLTLSIKAINLGQRQSNFIDSVTHELKSPIASLKLYLQTLNRRQLGAEEQASFYRDMLEDVERLDTLINHLLDVARLERTRKPSEVEDIDLKPLLVACGEAALIRHQLPPNSLQLEIEPCTVRATRVDLDLIFRNLIDNAMKYAGDPPRVEIKANLTRTDRVTIRVRDNGRGIDPQERRKIFGRFVRLGSELERDKPGTGLGLYIVRTLISRLRGKIRVLDNGKEPGTTFELTLPGKPPEPTPAEEGSTEWLRS